MKSYKDLNEKEKQQLLKYPAYISLLASTAEGSIDEQEKETAVKLVSSIKRQKVFSKQR